MDRSRPVHSGPDRTSAEPSQRSKESRLPALDTRRPMVSVGLYVLNAVGTVARALRSIADQDYDNLEIVVVDGASTDGTPDVIRDVMRQFADRDLTVISEPDQGPVHAANKALALGRGEIQLFVMADDWLEPGAVTRIAAAFADHPHAAIVSAGARIVVEEAPGRFVSVLERSGTDNAMNLEVLLGIPMTAARFWRRDYAAAFGGHKTWYPAAHDRDWFVRSLLSGAECVTLDPILYTYVQHPGSTTLGGNPAAIRRFLGEHVLLVKDWLPLARDMHDSDRLIAWRREQLSAALMLDLRTHRFGKALACFGKMIYEDPANIWVAVGSLAEVATSRWSRTCGPFLRGERHFRRRS